jgi:hypothetical protein
MTRCTLKSGTQRVPSRLCVWSRDGAAWGAGERRMRCWSHGAALVPLIRNSSQHAGWPCQQIQDVEAMVVGFPPKCAHAFWLARRWLMTRQAPPARTRARQGAALRRCSQVAARLHASPRGALSVKSRPPALPSALRNAANEVLCELLTPEASRMPVGAAILGQGSNMR